MQRVNLIKLPALLLLFKDLPNWGNGAVRPKKQINLKSILKRLLGMKGVADFMKEFENSLLMMQ